LVQKNKVLEERVEKVWHAMRWYKEFQNAFADYFEGKDRSKLSTDLSKLKFPSLKKI